MQKHWKAVQWGAIVALAAFIVAIMTHNYALVYGVLVATLMIGGAYMIAIARFKDRPDPEKDEKHAH